MGQTMYDRKFKEQVVKRILNKETSIGKMAEELDLHYTTIRNWVRQHNRDGQDAFPGKGYLKSEDEALRKLRKELDDLKEENAILKKAAAYFAKNQK
jgi:transposase